MGACMNKKSYLIALALGLASFLMHKGGFALASAFAPAFRLETLDISGQRLVSDFSSLEALKGRPLRFINLTQIKEELLRHPLIANAAVRKEYPSALKVILTEHIPLAEIHSGGTIYVVNADALTLPLRPQGLVPQIYADFGIVLNGAQIIDENIAALLPVLAIPAAKNLAALSLSRDKGLAFTLKGALTSFFIGGQALTETHLKRAGQIAEDIAQKKTRAPKTVDLSSGGDAAVGYY